MLCRVPARDLTTWYFDDRNARVFGTRDPARHLTRCAICRRIIERLAPYVAVRAEVADSAAAIPPGAPSDEALLDAMLDALPPRQPPTSSRDGTERRTRRWWWPRRR